MAGRARTRPAPTTSSLEEVAAALAARRAEALAAGVGEDAILLDPCFGFGKSTASDLALLAGLRRLRELGSPLLAAVSHKEFTRRRQRARGGRTCAARSPPRCLAARDGAEMLRLHDVAEIAPALRLADAVRRAEAAA